MADLDTVKQVQRQLITAPGGYSLKLPMQMHHRVLLEFNPRLTQATGTLENLDINSVVWDPLLLDLIIHGENSDTFHHIEQLWRDLAGVGPTSAVPTHPNIGPKRSYDRMAAIGRFIDWALEWVPDVPSEVASNQRRIIPPLMKLPKIKTGDVNQATRIASITRGRAAAEEFLAIAVYNGLQARWRFESAENKAYLDTLMHTVNAERRGGVTPSSPTHKMASSWEYCSMKCIGEFSQVIREYNLEWANASFDWSGGRRRKPSALARMQSILDESPWEKESAHQEEEAMSHV